MSTATRALREKVSNYTMVLAGILFIGLVFYAIGPIIQLPEFFYMLFPVWIWSKIAVTNGDTYLVTGSICLLMILTIPLFIWGYAYPEKKHYAVRLRIWLVLFIILLAYSFVRAAIVHISAIPALRKTPTCPEGMYPIPTDTVDEIMSQTANIPPIYSVASIVFIVSLCFYAMISVKILSLLRNVKKADGLEKDLFSINGK